MPYNLPMLKRSLAVPVLVLSTLYLVLSTSPALASEVTDEQIICPQPYGGGVVCGVKTHTPVNTGIADNLPLLGAGFILASGAFYVLSRKLSRVEA